MLFRSKAIEGVRAAVGTPSSLLQEEIRFAEVAALHFASVAAQSRFVVARNAGDRNSMRAIANEESSRAIRLHALQSADARIGFEASNQYFYTPLDVVEKVVNCRWIAGEIGR